MHGVLGGVVDPHAAYLLIRSLKSLDLTNSQLYDHTALQLYHLKECKTSKTHCKKPRYILQVRKMHGVLGGVVDPHAAYLLNRGLKTLVLRVKQQNANAQVLPRADKAKTAHKTVKPDSGRAQKIL